MAIEKGIKPTRIPSRPYPNLYYFDIFLQKHSRTHFTNLKFWLRLLKKREKEHTGKIKIFNSNDYWLITGFIHFFTSIILYAFIK